MKRIISGIVLGLVVLTSTSVAFGEDEEVFTPDFVFGNYEQDNITEDGTEPLEWMILSENQGKALITTYLAIDYLPYNEEKESLTWEDSTIRKWLNGDFLNTAFSEEEQSIIQETSVINDKGSLNSEWETLGGNNTTDKIFLLSYDEVESYFGGPSVAPASSYAIDNGAGGLLSDNTDWWLRSPGKEQDEACAVGKKYKSEKVKEKLGICPTMWVNLEADRSAFPYERDGEAFDLLYNGQYLEAKEIFDQLNGYNFSKYDAGFCLYAYTVAAFETEDLNEVQSRALAFIDYMKNNPELPYSDYLAEDWNLYNPDIEYIPIDKLMSEATYQLGIQATENGDDLLALKEFETINQYSDCMEKMIALWEKNHIPYSYLTSEIGSAVNADDDYSKEKQLDDKDPHFGWGLGRFLISGYTEHQDDNGIPVFIKTTGDDVKLWFDLNQDIDCLNGNEKLTISYDKKSSDKEFQIPKSDFGRGALFIKHKKAGNGDEDISEFRDYLSAKETACADTMIEIKEEGIYTIALDYHIENSNLKEIINKDNYYRIRFEFEVRNGSDMCYFFDTETGSELQDYGISMTGFKVDCANSKSLSIHVSRYDINQAGTAFDLRGDAPAADCEVFDKVGYYEITATNTETGNEMTKHLFIGTDSDLERFKKADTENKLINF